MLNLLFSLVSFAAAMQTFGLDDYRKLEIASIRSRAEDLPPLYRDLAPHFGHLKIYFAVADQVSLAFLDAEYYVRRADGRWVTVNTGFRQLRFVSTEAYNAGLAEGVRRNLKIAEFANAEIEDMREPYFAENSVVLGVNGADRDFFQELSLALPVADFNDPARDFYLQVRLKHLEGREDDDHAVRARRFIHGYARVSRLSDDEKKAIHRLSHLVHACDHQLAH